MLLNSKNTLKIVFMDKFAMYEFKFEFINLFESCLTCMIKSQTWLTSPHALLNLVIEFRDRSTCLQNS